MRVLQLLSGRIFYFAHDYPPGYFRDAIVHPPDTFWGYLFSATPSVHPSVASRYHAEHVLFALAEFLVCLDYTM